MSYVRTAELQLQEKGVLLEASGSRPSLASPEDAVAAGLAGSRVGPSFGLLGLEIINSPNWLVSLELCVDDKVHRKTVCKLKYSLKTHNGAEGAGIPSSKLKFPDVNILGKTSLFKGCLLNMR